jgi:predicted RNase H-like HicB family nuclease
MKKVIRINIKEHNDFTHPYFLATSPDVYGFLVQGNSVEEVMELVPEVLHDFLEVLKEIEEKKQKNIQQAKQLQAILKSKKLLMQYIYEQPFSLQLA